MSFHRLEQILSKAKTFMAQHSFVAFQWTGVGYNGTYNTSHTAVIDDDDAAFEGSGDASETISIDGATAVASTGQPYVIKVAFTDTSGNSHVEDFQFFSAGNQWFFAPGDGSAFTVGATLGGYQSHTVGWNYEDVDTIACFVAGTRIETVTGPRAVESLRPGAQVSLAHGRVAKLRQNLSTLVSARRIARDARLRPICIRKGALGQGLPSRDLFVSRQHRMVLRSAICRRMFDRSEALVAAVHLLDLPGVSICEPSGDIRYHHLLFDRHEVILAENAPAESFLPGPMVKGLIPDDLQAEFSELFGERAGTSRHLIPAGRQQKRLVERHAKNRKPLLA